MPQGFISLGLFFLLTAPIILMNTHLSPGGPSPHKPGETFDGPPTLERSGSEHRRAVTSLIPMVGI